MGAISRLYEAAQKAGMDQRIAFDDYLKLDDITYIKLNELRNDEMASMIIRKPINTLVKSDIDYILNNFA